MHASHVQGKIGYLHAIRSRLRKGTRFPVDVTYMYHTVRHLYRATARWTFQPRYAKALRQEPTKSLSKCGLGRELRELRVVGRPLHTEPFRTCQGAMAGALSECGLGRELRELRVVGRLMSLAKLVHWVVKRSRTETSSFSPRFVTGSADCRPREIHAMSVARPPQGNSAKVQAVRDVLGISEERWVNLVVR
jgi:hypothetical protein